MIETRNEYMHAAGKLHKRALSFTLATILSAGAASAAITLPDIVGENMVLQQNTDARLWGWATPGSEISVRTGWNGKTAKARAGSDGRWDVTVATPAATFTPQSIRIKGDGSDINLSNVLVGEVWFCSGQSNMEMPLRGFWTQPVEGAAEAKAYSAEYPGIRVAKAPKTISYTPQDKVISPWKTSCPENAAEFSALAYFFAQSLTRILNVPIGIIDCTYGGSKLEGWLSAERLATYPEWSIEKEKNDSTIQHWERINVMYNGMLRPLQGYTIAGFLWNQGESNVGRHDTYPQHTADMVADWRKAWGNENLPFYFVEIPGWEYSDPKGIDAALFRECQHKAAEITPNSGIVCTTDLTYPYEVKDIHARQKKPIGERLAFMAANRHYGIKGIPCEYPEFKSMTVNGDKSVLTFTGANDGFSPNQTMEGFEVAGTDGIFRPAMAREDYDSRNIIVERPERADSIVAVRYCFRNFAPGEVRNLWGLPLVPFRTDSTPATHSIVKAGKDGLFIRDGKEHSYIGTNLWYAPILASDGTGGDIKRLERELDKLKNLGITNLRILAGAQGRGDQANHISPILEPEPGVYNDTLLVGLDRTLDMLEKRGMTAVIFLNNAWEWSGGYGTFLEWAGEGPTPNPAHAGYPAYMKHVSRFVKNEKAKQLSADFVRKIVSRVSSVTGKPYSESPAIFSWQIANEPRAFADDPETKKAFADWIASQAALIKSIDPNHMVSTGSEGVWGCENDLRLWARIHEDPNIDYGLIHIWPYNWGWAREKSLDTDADTAIANAREYIAKHSEIMKKAGKPLVVEEFGYPRDGMSHEPGSPTTGRDKFYRYIFSEIGKGKPLAGCNFWGWGGEARPKARIWETGADYVCDPAQEGQGLNSVFEIDSTLDLF